MRGVYGNDGSNDDESYYCHYYYYLVGDHSSCMSSSFWCPIVSLQFFRCEEAQVTKALLSLKALGLTAPPINNNNIA